MPLWIFPLLVLTSKFGIASAFNINYVANSILFPALFSASALGFSDFIGEIATIFAPEVAEK